MALTISNNSVTSICGLLVAKGLIKQESLDRRLFFHFLKDPAINQVVELGNADENRDSFLMEGFENLLSLQGVEEAYPCSHIKRENEIHYQGQDMIKGKHRQKVIFRGHLNLLEHLGDVAIDVAAGQHDPFGVSRGAAGIKNDKRLVQIPFHQRERPGFGGLFENGLPVEVISGGFSGHQEGQRLR